MAVSNDKGFKSYLDSSKELLGLLAGIITSATVILSPLNKIPFINSDKLFIIMDVLNVTVLFIAFIVIKDFEFAISSHD